MATRHLPARHVTSTVPLLAFASSLQLLRLELPRCFPDHHLWASLFLFSGAHAFTRTQRLGTSLSLLLGYAAVNAVSVSLAERTVGAQTQASLSPEVGSHEVQILCYCTCFFQVSHSTIRQVTLYTNIYTFFPSDVLKKTCRYFSV